MNPRWNIAGYVIVGHTNFKWTVYHVIQAVERDFELRNYRVSAGFGFRLTVPFMGPVPIALDFGFPIVKGPFDNEQIFNFYLGIQR